MNAKLQEFLQRGLEQYQNGAYEAAYQLFSRAIHLVEEHGEDEKMEPVEIAELYTMRASSLVAQDQAAALTEEDIFNQAIDDYDQALSFLPHSPLHLNLRGEMYLKSELGEFALEAKEDFEHALKHQANNPVTLRNLGEACTKLEAFDDALYYLTQALEEEQDAETFRLRAMAYLRKHPANLGAAATDFGQAIRLEPDRKELYEWRAQAYQAQGKMTEALDDYDRLVAMAPRNAHYLIDRAVLRMEEDPEGAMKDFTAALALEENALAYNNRAFLHYQEEDFESAIADAKAALRVDPSASIAYATLAEIYAALGDREQLYPYLQIAVDEYYTDIVEVMSHPGFEPYLQEERFQQILASSD